MKGDKGLYCLAATLLLTCFLIAPFLVQPANAQTELNRISVSERSDGQGMVVRYHLSEPVDSFNVVQPAVQLIQMKLYAEQIDTSGIRITEPDANIRSVRLTRLEDGYGY